MASVEQESLPAVTPPDVTLITVDIPDNPAGSPTSMMVSVEEVPPTPRVTLSDVTPIKVEIPDFPKRSPMSRPGTGTDGQLIQLSTNHFSVCINVENAIFYRYNISIKYDDKSVVEGKGICRKVMDKLFQIYRTDLAGQHFAYDGEKSLFTVGPLPRNDFKFTVILEESSARASAGSPGDGDGSPNQGDLKRTKRCHLAKTFEVEISYATSFELKSTASAAKGSETEHSQDVLRVLDIILRQQQAKRGCLLVRQCYFNGELTSLTNLGGGVTSCRGFHSSFRATQGGLSLNMDVSTTLIVTPGPVLDYLLANQNIRDPRQIDWEKAKKMLKNIRVKTRHTNMEFKIIGLSELPCDQQLFPLKIKDNSGKDQIVETSVSDYFISKKVELTWSTHMPCLNVGKTKRPSYLPLELCNVVSLQRYTKTLSSQQRASLLEKSRQKPLERIRAVTDAVINNHYGEDPLLTSCGILIKKELGNLNGRVLAAPTLKVGNQEDFVPQNGRWNFSKKKLWEPTKIELWGIVNFSARCDLSYLSRELISCGRNIGMQIERPHTLIEEDHKWVKSGPVARVEHMIGLTKVRFPRPPQFLLCVLPEKKNSDLYGPWKKKNLHELGVVTQCIAPIKISDQYLTNVLLKINSKLGGINSLLAVEHSHSIPMISTIPTLILGMDVSHSHPGRSDIPSIAAVVGSRNWPLISRYRASVRTQLSKVEIIESLFKLRPDGEDDGIISELAVDFYQTSGSRKPSQVIIFRDGVSESQFDQVLNVELNQICKAFQHLGVDSLPKFTVIVAQKKHHTKLFKTGASENVPPGTVVDTTVVHPIGYDFYMCSHAGIFGTSRPTHYHVLLDEIGFSVDDLQKLVHSLCYVCQRSSAAVSVVAPVYYAHLAARQMSQFMKFEFAETSLANGEITTAGPPVFPELPRLHDYVCESMFFC